MKKLLFITLISNGLLLAMDKPEGWKPTRPSGSGRPRPTVINYGTSPLPVAPQQHALPLATQQPTPTPVLTNEMDTDPDFDAQMARFMNPLNEPQTPQIPAQFTTPQLDKKNKKEKKDKSKPAPTFAGMTAKEGDRLHKIEKDLDKLEEVLKEMGIDLGCAALSAACLDPIGAAFSASSSVIHIPKLAYYYGNMQKHIFFLSSSKTSPEAKARLKQLTPRLQTVSRVLAKGPESLQKLIKKFSKEEPKEAK